MFDVRKAALAGAVATLALAAGSLSASAQSTGLTNGPNGMQPNTLRSESRTTGVGKTPSRGIYHRRNKTMRTQRHSMNEMSYGPRRPLTVRRTVAAVEAPVVAAPTPFAGPGAIVTGPLGFASNVISLPFRVLGGIFPATGDIASNPLVIIGAPLRAFGDIAQVPFRVIGAPFGGTTIATY